MQLDTGLIPGGWYARSKLMDYRGGTSPSYLVSSKKWLALMTWTRTVHHWSFLSKPSRDAPLPPLKSHPPIEIRYATVLHRLRTRVLDHLCTVRLSVQ